MATGAHDDRVPADDSQGSGAPTLDSSAAGGLDSRDLICAIAPSMATRASEKLTGRDVQHVLVRAIWARRLADVADVLVELPMSDISDDGTELATAASACCAAISACNRIDRDTAVARLRDVGVETVANDEPVETQIRAFELRLRASDLPAAVDTLRRLGYEHPHNELSPDDIRDFARRTSAVVLFRSDDVSGRVTVRWERPTKLVKPNLMALAHRVVRRIRRGTRAPDLFIATPTELIAPLLELVGVTSDDTLIDLGCGDGRVVAEAARLTGCRARGVESDPDLVARARATVEALDLGDRVRIGRSEIADAELNDVTIAFAFLPVGDITHELPRLRHRLPAGAKIIVHEQAEPPTPLHADREYAVFASSSLTVAHVWTVGA